jgi:hypothetical protein
MPSNPRNTVQYIAAHQREAARKAARKQFSGHKNPLLAAREHNRVADVNRKNALRAKVAIKLDNDRRHWNGRAHSEDKRSKLALLLVGRRNGEFGMTNAAVCFYYFFVCFVILWNFPQIAKEAGAGISSVTRMTKKLNSVGWDPDHPVVLFPKARGGGRRAALTGADEAFVVETQRDDPKLRLAELQTMLKQLRAVTVSIGTIFRCLLRNECYR